MHKSKINKFKIFSVFFIILIVFIDQLTKNIVTNNLIYTKQYPIFAVISDKLNFGANWFLTHNYGSAFSLIQKATGSIFILLLLMSVAITVFLFYWLIKAQDNNKLNIISISLITGGALGNIYDRFAQGYVVDFIDFYAGHWHWPIFNVADIAISSGVILLILQLLFDRSAKY